MGNKLTISTFSDNEEEQMQKVLLELANDRFIEFKEAVLADKKLREKFYHATNNQEGDFFTNSFAAVGYMKNEVFSSKEKTKLVY
jgi:hypothetical protein